MLSDVSSTAVPAQFDADERTRLRSWLRQLQRRELTSATPRAAVVVPLCHVNGRAAVLFTKRTETVSTHKGQVSFPGGRMDDVDVDEVACALRELEEEVGIDAADVDVLGVFHDALSITQMRVTPVVAFVGELGDLSRLRPSAAEIDVAFTLDIVDLVDPNKRKMQQLGPRRVPAFTGGPHVVWGLTAFILDELLREGFFVSQPS